MFLRNHQFKSTLEHLNNYDTVTVSNPTRTLEII